MCNGIVLLFVNSVMNPPLVYLSWLAATMNDLLNELVDQIHPSPSPMKQKPGYSFFIDFHPTPIAYTLSGFLSLLFLSSANKSVKGPIEEWDGGVVSVYAPSYCGITNNHSAVVGTLGVPRHISVIRAGGIGGKPLPNTINSIWQSEPLGPEYK